MHIVRYTFGNHVLWLHSRIAVKLNFDRISDDIPPQMKILNTVTREMLQNEGKGSTWGMLMHLKAMFGHYYCIKTMIYSPKLTKNVSQYFITISLSTDSWTFSLVFVFHDQTIYMSVNGSAVVKCSGLEPVYLRYQKCALTTCELPF